jgi:outer membrane protein assembly factor BamA/autotransporter translocation and assembly factor TamB
VAGQDKPPIVASSPTRAPRAPRARRVLRITLLILGVLAGVTGLLLMGLHTPPAKRYVLGRVAEWLATREIDLQARSIDYNLFGLSLVVDDLVVSGREVAGAPPFARIARLSLNLSLRDLIRGIYIVRSADVTNPRIHVFIDDQGRTNMPRWTTTESSASSEPIDYLIERFRLTDARIRFEDHRQHLTAILPIASLTIDGDYATRLHQLRIKAAAGELVLHDRKADIDRLDGAIAFDRDTLRVDQFDIGAAGSTISLGGNLVKFNDPRYDVSLTGRLDVSRLAAFAGVNEPIGGFVRAEVNARGPFTEMAVRTKLRSDDLSFRTLDRLRLDTESVYDVPSRQARIERLDLQTPQGRIHGDGVVALDDKAGESHVNATIEGLDIGRLARALDLPYGALTRADGQVSARWPLLEFERATGDARLNLTPTASAPARGLAPIGGAIAAGANAGRIAVNVTSLRGLGATIDGRVTVARPAARAGAVEPATASTTANARAGARSDSGGSGFGEFERAAITGTLNARADDIARVIAAAEAFLGRARGSLVGSPLAGALTANAAIAGTVGNPRVDTTVDAPNVTAGSVSGIALNADATYAPDLVTLRRADVTWREATAHANGTIGLSGRQPLALQATVDGMALEPALAAAGYGDIPASGLFSMQAQASGTLKNPQATVAVRGADLAAYGETFGAVSLDAALLNQRIELTSLRLDKPQPGGNGELTARGSYDLDRRGYTLSLDSRDLRLTTLTLPDGTPVRGTIDLRANGQGTIENPAGNATFTLADIRVRGDDFGTVNANVEVANGQATIRADADRFKAAANAVIATAAPYAATGDIAVNDFDVKTLPPSIALKAGDSPIEGTIRAKVTGQGELSRPEQSSATASIDALALTINNHPITTDGPATIRYANREVTIDRLIVKAEDSTLSVRGTLPLDALPLDQVASTAAKRTQREGAIELDAKVNLETLARYAPPSLGLQAQGELALNGQVRGTLRAIDPTLTLSVGGASFMATGLEPGLRNVAARVDVANGAARITSIHAEWASAKLDASGEIPFGWLPTELPVEIPRANGPAQVKADITGLDLATIPGVPETVTGTVAAHAEASAPTPDVNTLVGRVTFPELQLAVSGLTLAQQQPSNIAIANGQVRVEQFTLDGTLGHVELAGTMGLQGDRPIDATAKANLNASVASAFTDAVRLGGKGNLEVAATGTVASPVVQGFAELTNGRLSMEEPTIGADGLQVRVDFTPERAVLSRLEGNLNGGTLAGSGGVNIRNGTLRDLDFNVKVTGFGLDEPMNLRSLSDADIRITQREETFVVGGTVTIEEGGLTDDINLDTGIFAALRAPRSLDLTEDRNPFLERVRLNVAVRTASPIIVDNNLARAEIDANVRVLGTPYETGLSGRLDVTEGSELILNERHYEVERGIVTFLDERRILPSLDLVMNTSARPYDVTISASGTPDDLETTLTSSPTLPEPDIMALLVTGRTLDEMRGEEFEVAKSQVLSYISGRVASQLGRGLERATGLSTVRVEPTLIANEADPSARLTVGQDLTQDLSLIYSADLVNGGNELWVAEYDVTRQFVTRAVRQEDATYRFDFRHDVRFGGEPEPRRQKRARPVISSLKVEGRTALDQVDEAEVRRKFGLEAGDRYDFFEAREGIDDLSDYYRKQQRLQARMRLQRVVKDEQVDVTLRVNPGPVVDLVFEGIPASNGLVKRAERIWQRGIFDTQRADAVKDEIRQRLIKDRYLDPSVEYTIEQPDPSRRRVVFRVEPGVRFEQVRLVFDGAQGIDPKELEGIIKEQKLGPRVFTEPGEVADLLKRVYREQGYLTAEVETPQYEFDRAARHARVILPVREGPMFHVRSLTFTGNRIYPSAALQKDMPFNAGDPYLPAATEQALLKLRQLYWSRGYNDVRPTTSLALDRTKGQVDVTFVVTEGPRTVIASIDVDGRDETSNRLVRGELDVEAGKPLDLAALGRTRKNLYDTGAFSLVDITREEVSPAPTEKNEAQAGNGNGPNQSNGQSAADVPVLQAEGADKPVTLNIKVREVQPWQIRYGALFDTERGPGGIVDISNHNSLGKARVLGLRTRYDSQVREGRIYFSQPSLKRLPLETIASIYAREERNPVTSVSDPFNVDRYGISIQQEKKLRNSYVWNYGYRFERSRTYEPDTTLPKPPLENVAPLTTSFTRETRDEVLDATRGSFLSHSFSFSPKFLGSDVPFIKYLGQYFNYFPLQEPKRKRFTNEILRPRLVYAVGLRLGLANGFGEEDVPLSERFLGGGSTTLRGFAQNSLGGVDAEGVPLGGEALFVINNELRFPLWWIVDGVAFIDVGNVFPHVNDFALSDMREAGGLGLRLRTPWFLVRVDYGVPLDRRPGESKSRAFFSIGQAF